MSFLEAARLKNVFDQLNRLTPVFFMQKRFLLFYFGGMCYILVSEH